MPDKARGKPEVVVVHPDSCALVGLGTGRIGETFIDVFENTPVGVVDVEMSWKSMKYWPEAFLGGDVIEA